MGVYSDFQESFKSAALNAHNVGEWDILKS